MQSINYKRSKIAAFKCLLCLVFIFLILIYGFLWVDQNIFKDDMKKCKIIVNSTIRYLINKEESHLDSPFIIKNSTVISFWGSTF